jgi:hypothetical protein
VYSQSVVTTGDTPTGLPAGEAGPHHDAQPSRGRVWKIYARASELETERIAGGFRPRTVFRGKQDKRNPARPGGPNRAKRCYAQGWSIRYLLLYPIPDGAGRVRHQIDTQLPPFVKISM